MYDNLAVKDNHKIAGLTKYKAYGTYANSESFAGTKSFNLSLEKGIYLVKLKGSKPFATQKLIIE